MKWLHVIGGAIAVAGILFVGIQLWGHADDVRNMDITNTGVVVLVVSAGLSGAFGLLLALAWGQLISHLKGNLSFKDTIRIYGISQIGKYVPGNVFHFAGRQAMGQQAGVPGVLMAKSALWEMGLIVAMSSLFALIALPYYLGLPPAVGVVSFATISAGVLVASRMYSDNVAAAALLHLAYLGAMGFVFVLVFSAVGAVSSVPLITSAYVVGWLVGVVTPGAPAGIGVRELVLYALLTPVSDASTIASAVVLGRLINVIGDTLLFLVAVSIRRPA